MSKTERLRALRCLGSILLIFALVAYKTDLTNAAFATASFVVGYLNVFYIVRTAIAPLKRQRVTPLEATVAILAFVGDLILINVGYSPVLGLATASCLIIDIVILRFR